MNGRIEIDKPSKMAVLFCAILATTFTIMNATLFRDTESWVMLAAVSAILSVLMSTAAWVFLKPERGTALAVLLVTIMIAISVSFEVFKSHFSIYNRYMVETEEIRRAIFLASELTDQASKDEVVSRSFGLNLAELELIILLPKNSSPRLLVETGDTQVASLAVGELPMVIEGTLTVMDDEIGDAVKARVGGVIVSGHPKAFSPPSNDALKSMLTVSPEEVVSSESRKGKLTWRFYCENAAFDDLIAGQAIVLNYTISVTDSQGAVGVGTVVVTIKGSKYVGPGAAPRITIEDGDINSANLFSSNAQVTAEGTLTVTDDDIADTVSASVSGVMFSGSTAEASITEEKLRAMLSVSPTTVLDSTKKTAKLKWTFNSGDETFGYLSSGQSSVLIYEIIVTDSSEAKAKGTETVVVSINGTRVSVEPPVASDPQTQTSGDTEDSPSFADLQSQTEQVTERSAGPDGVIPKILFVLLGGKPRETVRDTIIDVQQHIYTGTIVTKSSLRAALISSDDEDETTARTENLSKILAWASYTLKRHGKEGNFRTIRMIFDEYRSVFNLSDENIAFDLIENVVFDEREIGDVRDFVRSKGDDRTADGEYNGINMKMGVIYGDEKKILEETVAASKMFTNDANEPDLHIAFDRLNDFISHINHAESTFKIFPNR